MRRIDLINIYRLFGGIRLNKVSDESLRNILIRNHLKIFRMCRENDDYVAALNAQYGNDAESVNTAYKSYALDEVDLGLEKMSREAFVKAVTESDIDFSLSDMIVFEPLLED